MDIWLFEVARALETIVAAIKEVGWSFKEKCVLELG